MVSPSPERRHGSDGTTHTDMTSPATIDEGTAAADGGASEAGEQAAGEAKRSSAVSKLSAGPLARFTMTPEERRALKNFKLVQAAKNNDLRRVRRYLERHADPNALGVSLLLLPKGGLRRTHLAHPSPPLMRASSSPRRPTSGRRFTMHVTLATLL